MNPDGAVTVVVLGWPVVVEVAPVTVLIAVAVAMLKTYAMFSLAVMNL